MSCMHFKMLFFQCCVKGVHCVRAGAAAVWGLLDKQALENCMGVLIMALAAVMAGTGDLRTFKLMRGKASDSDVLVMRIVSTPGSASMCWCLTTDFCTISLSAAADTIGLNCA